MNSLATVATGGFSGRTAMARTTTADALSKDALDHSALAYQLSKHANASGKREDHDKAAKMLRMAADSHDQSADAYEAEGNVRRAEEERGLAQTRIEAAKRHEGGDGDGGSAGTDFLAEAKSLSAREKIPLDQAASIVSARRPDLFDEYQSQFHGRGSGMRTVARASHSNGRFQTAAPAAGSFEAEARAMSARTGIAFVDACRAVCRAKPSLYQKYRAQFPRR